MMSNSSSASRLIALISRASRSASPMHASTTYSIVSRWLSAMHDMTEASGSFTRRAICVFWHAIVATSWPAASAYLTMEWRALPRT